MIAAQAAILFLKFEFVCVTGPLLNTPFLTLQFNLLHINRYLANGIASGVVTGWNFWLNMRLSWRSSSAATPSLPE